MKRQRSRDFVGVLLDARAVLAQQAAQPKTKQHRYRPKSRSKDRRAKKEEPKKQTEERKAKTKKTAS